MKFFLNTKLIVMLITAIAVCSVLQAQEFKTNVSTAQQIKNNAVPGLNYASPSAPRPATVSKGFTGSSLGHQLKQGLVPGMKISTGSGQSTTAKAEKQNGLASEMSAEQVKAAAEQESKKQADLKPVVPPTQEEKPKEEAKPKEN